MKQPQIIGWAFADALGVFLYTLGIGWLMMNGDHVFSGSFAGKTSFIGPAFFLLLFIVSALVTAGLVLGRPLYLFINHDKKAALNLLLMTVAWLLLIMCGVLIWMVQG